VRERLLTAARELFLRYGYRAVSSRQISGAAGANVAMIRYYFGGKPGCTARSSTRWCSRFAPVSTL
jgi:AcrR family transcriptional regulator